jgi:scyllo-inositol 2-dehydrogenase (NADP+)
MKVQRLIHWLLATRVTLALLASTMPVVLAGAQLAQDTARTRIAVVGLDHDHVWSLLKDITKEPMAELVAISDPDPELVSKAKKQVPETVKFYSDYVQMLDQAKPEAVIVATSNDRHLEILRECAKRHIHYSTEKPMAATAAEAREMERLASASGIKLMVNYWNAWVAPTHTIFHKVSAGELGPMQRIIVQYGHRGPKEIGISKQFANWLYDPKKNGGGAIMDFGCYGAELSLWLKGRPARVFASTRKLKTEQHNEVDDDATIVLEYPDATAILEASWDWPYTKEQVEVFGPKGSLLAGHEKLLFRSAEAHGPNVALNGEPVALDPLSRETSNPISYLVDCIRNNKPIENPLAAKLNVQVMELLDAARESARTGRVVELH